MTGALTGLVRTGRYDIASPSRGNPQVKNMTGELVGLSAGFWSQGSRTLV